MADINTGFNITLDPKIEEALKASLANIPTASKAIEALKGLGVDTTAHEAKLASLKASAESLLGMFGSK